MEFVNITLAWDGEGVSFGLTLTYLDKGSEGRFGYTKGATGPPEEAAELIRNMVEQWAAYGLIGIETQCNRDRWQRMVPGPATGLPVTKVQEGG